jgi:hypothetical protein
VAQLRQRLPFERALGTEGDVVVDAGAVEDGDDDAPRRAQLDGGAHDYHVAALQVLGNLVAYVLDARQVDLAVRAERRADGDDEDGRLVAALQMLLEAQPAARHQLADQFIQTGLVEMRLAFPQTGENVVANLGADHVEADIRHDGGERQPDITLSENTDRAVRKVRWYPAHPVSSLICS